MKSKVALLPTLGFAAILLGGCAATSAHRDSDLDRLHLFGTDGAPRFSFCLSCAGEVSTETQMCWVASKYFRRWADERHVSMITLGDGAPFDAAVGVPADQRRNIDARVDYVVIVRFAPIAVASYTSEADGMGGYAPPKAGYLADVYVYARTSGGLIAHATYHKKSAAGHRADAIPYVKAGVQAVVAALDPGYTIHAD